MSKDYKLKCFINFFLFIFEDNIDAFESFNTCPGTK